MSIGVKINENYISKKFRPVDKVKVKNQGEGTSLWLPVSRVDVAEKTITKNGYYYAVNDSVDGYWQVNVNVPSEMDEDDKASGKSVSGKGSDGNDYKYTTEKDEETGEEYLNGEMIPSAIHIVIPPTKREYSNGETLDFSGIHVYLMDGNNNRFTDENYPTGEIPFEELEFPVKTAQGETPTGGDGTHYTNGQGLNCVYYDFTETMRNLYGTFNYSKTVMGTIHDWAGWDDGDVFPGIRGGSGSAYMTRYYDSEHEWYRIYGYAIDFAAIYFSIIQPSSSGNGNHGIFAIQQWVSLHQTAGDDEPAFANIPISTVDPATITDMSDLTPTQESTANVPVQWTRSDEFVLEDHYSITVN